MLDVLLIIGLALAFPLLHLANSWMFSFLEISPNIALIYLPAFLRLLNVLVLGKLRGTVAGLLGGALLILGTDSSDPMALRVTNMVCSSASPVVALLLFEHWRRRAVHLRSLPDLAQLTLVYCLINAVMHHLAWAVMAPQNLRSPEQMLWMTIGDLAGTLIGAYVLKWVAGRADAPGQPPR